MSIAPLKPVDMTTPSSDTLVYIQQMFEFAAHPDRYAALVGTWPSEVTDDGDRPAAIVQQVAAILGTGPHYTKDPLLSNAQVLWSYQQWGAHGVDLNPAYSKALERGNEVAGRHKADAPIPWASHSQPVFLKSEGSYGLTPVSGYYGTGHGTLK